MSTKVFRSIHDFVRFRCNVRIQCRCGHSAVMTGMELAQLFRERRWPIGIDGAVAHFRCRHCRRRAVRLVPEARD